VIDDSEPSGSDDEVHSCVDASVVLLQPSILNFQSQTSWLRKSSCSVQPTTARQLLPSFLLIEAKLNLAETCRDLSPHHSLCRTAARRRFRQRRTMASTSIFRLAARAPVSTVFKPALRSFRQAPLVASQVQSGCARSAFSTSLRRTSAGHEEETFEEFSARYDNPHGQVEAPSYKAASRRCSRIGRIMIAYAAFVV
jgi:hypothetical protein